MPPAPIAVALDVPTMDEAVSLASTLAGEVAVCKVGLELFSAHGPDVVAAVGAHAPVFLDLKLHDIPTTVERACRVLGGSGIAMVTVHATGAAPMISAAVEGLRAGWEAAGAPGEEPIVLAVTVLTSMSDDDLASVGMPDALDEVPRLATVAAEAGAQGLVCAPRDVAQVRTVVGPRMRLVTPGVRPAGSGDDDHARAATPAGAVRDGADLLVVGRPITRAEDPVAAARAIGAEVATIADATA